MNLKQKTINGLFWSIVERFGTKGISILFSIFLARILSPEDYGIVAMPMMFFALASCLLDFGIGDSLVRKQNLEKIDLDTAFLFSTIVSIVCIAVLWIASPFIADFFYTPILEVVVKVSALNILFSPLGLLQGILLVRDVDFKRIARITFISSIICGVLGIFLALKGYGVWSLVIQGILGQLIRCVLLWNIVSWHPSLSWSNDSFRYFWNYGCKMTVARVMGVFAENTYPMIIGIFYSPSMLGNFMKGLNISSLFSQQATDTIQRVTYPILCKMQNDENVLSENYSKILELSSFVIFPLMVGLVVSAESIVCILLGDQWGAVVPLLRIIALAMMFYHIHAICMNILKLKGRSDIHLYLDIAKTILGIILLLLAVKHDIIWVAFSIFVLSVTSLFLNIHFSGRLLGLGLKCQFTVILPILFFSFIMGLIVLWINQYIHSLYLQLPIDIIVGGILYWCLSTLFMKETLSELKRFLFIQ